MTPHYHDDTITLYTGDAATVAATLEPQSTQTVVTSPPYFGLRDYGVDGQLGAESSPAEFVANLVAVFEAIRPALKDDGTLWVNLGSSYASGSPSGPQGATGQRAGRAFTAEGVGAFASSARRDARPGDMTGTARGDCSGPGCACSDLCDGCADVQSRHNARTSQPLSECEPPHGPRGRDTEPADSASAPHPASTLGVQESTTRLSSEPLRATCSHCRNCGACLAVLRSSSRDARLCGRTGGYSHDTAGHESDGRNRDKDESGMAWLNYTADLSPKNLLLIPAMFAMAMQMNRWVLRNDIIWAKPNGMPESVRDRFSTKHEHVFLFAKSARYYFDLDAVRQPLAESSIARLAQDVESQAGSERVPGKTNGAMKAVRPGKGGGTNLRPTGAAHRLPADGPGANPGDWWEIATRPFTGAHFATFPPELPRRCILASTREGDTVLDPFSGSGTTGMVATKHGRRYIGIDLNPEYHELALKTRLAQGSLA